VLPLSPGNPFGKINFAAPGVFAPQGGETAQFDFSLKFDPVRLMFSENPRTEINSTGPTSVSIDLKIRKGAGARPEDQLRQRSTLG
jgi:hypothetical protein